MMRNLSGWKNSLLALALVSGAGALHAQTFTVPAVVTSYETTPYTGLTQTQSIAVDAAGDIFYTNPTTGALIEQPANGSAPITLYTAASAGGGYAKGVAANATYAYESDYGGNLWQVPIAGGAAKNILAACNSLDGGYLGTYDIATDGLGNVYTVGSAAPIYKITSAGACSQVAGATTDSGSTHVAADAAGDLAYSASGKLYSLLAGSTTAVQVNATFSSIVGLRADAEGNVFVTTGTSIIEVPFVNGALNGADAFTVLNQSSAADVAVGVDGTIYTAGGGNIYKNTIGNISYPANAVATASAAQTVNVVFNTATTLTNYRLADGAATTAEIINTGGGSCSHTGIYAAGATCTLTLQFKPSMLGLRNDALVLLTATGNAGEMAVYGRGTGAGLTVDPGTQTTLGTGWTAPAGVATDAAGNIFATDSTNGTVSEIVSGSTTAASIATNLSHPGALTVGPDGSVYVISGNTIVEIPYSGTTFGAATTVLTGLNQPTALQFDAVGNLYVANTGSGTVVRVPNQSGMLNFSTMAVAATLTTPDGMAVDAAGNVYVADRSAGTISKVTPTSAAVIVSGLTSPGALAVDDAGSLYVLQNSGAVVTRIADVNGAYSTNSTTSLGSGFTKLVSVAIDNAGNLYVADSAGPSVTQIKRIAGLLNLGKSNELTPTTAQSIIFNSAGDTALVFNTPLYTASGDTADFTISTTASNQCTAGASLGAGSSCAIAASFDPITTGPLMETLTLSSNAKNGTITGAFSGTGVNLPKTTTTLTTTPSGTTSYGTSVTANVTVMPQITSTTTPTGTVTFFVNGVSYITMTLVSGQAAATITGLPAGPDTIDASYSGDNNYAASSAQTANINVSLAQTTTTFTSSATSATPVPPGTSVTLTAIVSSSVTSSHPTGTVAFMIGNTTFASAPVSNTGQAQVITTTLPTGTYSIVAVYSGDTGFAGSTSNSIQVSILAPTYLVANPPTALTVTAPGSVSATFQIQPISGYIGGVDFACAGLPANTQCSFTPATVQFTGTNLMPQPITLIVTTDKAPSSTVAWVFPLSALLMAFAWSRRRNFAISGNLLALLLAAITGATLFGMSGCGGTNLANTPTGTSTVTVNMTGTPNGTTTAPTTGANNILESFSFSLTVK